MHTLTYGPARGRLPDHYALRLVELSQHAHTLRSTTTDGAWQETPEYQAVMRAIDAVADDARRALPHLFRGAPC
nr:MAG TPA: hypothetical protein [Caudoviricetes sp.]